MCSCDRPMDGQAITLGNHLVNLEFEVGIPGANFSNVAGDLLWATNRFWSVRIVALNVIGVQAPNSFGVTRVPKLQLRTFYCLGVFRHDNPPDWVDAPGSCLKR